MAGSPKRKAHTEAEVEYLLRRDLRLAGSVVWKTGEQDVYATLVVANSVGENVRMHIRIVRAIPWRYHIVLRWHTTEMRKLDVRDMHTNPDAAGDIWENETHKHRHTDLWQGSWAYTPVGMPMAADAAVVPEEYGRAFEAFCEECGIDTAGFTWKDPVIPPREEQL